MNKALTSLTLTILLAGCEPAMASSPATTLHLGAWSHHYGWGNSITNETHNLVAVENSGYALGYFENSYGRDTIFMAKSWRGYKTQRLSFSAALGLSYGYKECYGDTGERRAVCPFGYVGAGYDVIQKEQFILRPTLKMLPGVVIFSPEIKF